MITIGDSMNEREEKIKSVVDKMFVTHSNFNKTLTSDLLD